MHHELPHKCIFRPCRRPVIEFPRIPGPSAPPARQSGLPRTSLSECACRCRSRFPGSCIFRLCRQRIFELPRISRSSAPPVLELSVSLELRSYRLRLPMSPAGFPASFIFRLGLGFELPGFPGFSLPWRRLMDHRVTPAFASSGFAVPASSGFPESCIYGWVNDASRSSRTLHPRLSPRMNLRIQSGYATYMPRLWMHSFNLIQAFTCRRTDLQNTDFNCVLHRPARVALRLQFPTGSSTGEELRPG